MDTIFALASAQGKAGVSVIRISGPQAYAAGRLLCGDLPKPRKAALRVLKDVNGAVIDQALVIVFEKGKSFTGEPVVELQTHGSPAVIRRVLGALGEIPECRMAEAGEFTRRAFDNGCLDLAQAEGLADLIDAETEAQRHQAMRSLSGEFGDLVAIWRNRLVRAAALLEASIDFADEEVPVDVTPEVRELLDLVEADIRRQIDGISISERIRDGFEVAIVGRPNVGKSTLLNALAGRDAAITSDIAGTTRDVIEVRMELVGLPVTLLDTAGLRDTEDQIEALGVARARDRAEAADLRVFLVEPGAEPEIEPRKTDIVAVTKADLNEVEQFSISPKYGYGIDMLVEKIGDILSKMAQRAGVATRERHRMAMKASLSHLATSRVWVQEGQGGYDIAAEELRLAIRSLNALVGEVDVEELLGEIFSRFCVGK